VLPCSSLSRRCCLLGVSYTKTLSYPDGQSISWSYDAAGNVSSETGTLGTASYDASGQPTEQSFSNGVVSTRSYSPARGWPLSIRTEKAGSVYQDLSYGYYPDGMVGSITSARPMEGWLYQYDALNRLTQATNTDTPNLSQSFQYDAIGNVTYNSQIGAYSYPAPGAARPHAVLGAGSRSYAYNALGRMTNRNGTVLQWNGQGLPSSSGNIAFFYDGLGQRVKKISGGETTLYVDSDYEVGPDGTVTKYLLAGKQVGSQFFALHRDHLGSIQSVTDGTGGEVRHQWHKPFGDQHMVTGGHLETRGWIGEREEETECVYLDARYYDPEIGRFISPDPFSSEGQALNRYSYSVNNPISYADPSGLFFIEPGGGGGNCICTGWVTETTGAGVSFGGSTQDLGSRSSSSCVAVFCGSGSGGFGGGFSWERPDYCERHPNSPQCGGGTGDTNTGGSGNENGNGNESGTGESGTTTTLKYCEKHPDKCAGGDGPGGNLLEGGEQDESEVADVEPSLRGSRSFTDCFSNCTDRALTLPFRGLGITDSLSSDYILPLLSGPAFGIGNTPTNLMSVRSGNIITVGELAAGYAGASLRYWWTGGLGTVESGGAWFARGMVAGRVTVGAAAALAGAAVGWGVGSMGYCSFQCAQHRNFQYP